MTGRRRAVLRAGLVTGAVLVIAGALWAVLQAVAATTREERVRLAGDVRSVALEVDQGDVEVRAAAGPIHAVARERSFLVGVGARAGIERGRARLRWACRLWTSCRVDVRARVPEDVALEARTGFGDLRVEGPIGDVDLVTRSGHVDARALAGPRARVEARHGAVLLVFAGAPSEVSVDVSSGDVEVVVPAGAYRLDLTTRGGELLLRGIRDDPRAERSITIDSTAGDVLLRATGAVASLTRRRVGSGGAGRRARRRPSPRGRR